MAFVYLLRCRDGSLYCGWSTDLDARLKKHEAGTASRYTALRGPVALAAAWETASKTQARSLEGKIKRLTASQKRSLAGGRPIEDLVSVTGSVARVPIS